MTTASAHLDIEALRAATPGCRDAVYLNNASSSLMADATLAAVTDHLRLEARLGVQRAAATVADRLAGGGRDAARLLGCAPEEVVFTTSNTQGWGAVLSAVRLGPGDVILTGGSEWGGNYGALRHLADRTGSRVEAIPTGEGGTLSVEALAGRLDDHVKLIAVTWVASGNGAVQPVARIGQLARAAGIPYLIDGAQAVGQLPSDVTALGCDALTAPGRKWLRGPQGSGLLYVRRGFADTHAPHLVDYFSAAMTEGEPVLRVGAGRFETAGLSVAVRLGLRAALRAHLADEAAIHDRIGDLAARLRAGLGTIAGITLRDTGAEPAGLVTFTAEGIAPGALRAGLAERGILATTVAAGYTPLDFAARGLSEVVRLSPHIFNTPDEIDRTLEAVRGVVARL